MWASSTLVEPVIRKLLMYDKYRRRTLWSVGGQVSKSWLVSKSANYRAYHRWRILT